MSAARRRKIYFALHKYVAILLGVWILSVGVTGALLVFQYEWEAALRPDLYRVAPGQRAESLQAIVDASLRGRPGSRVLGFERELVVDNEAWKVYLGRATDAAPRGPIVSEREWTVFVDPYRLAVLGERRGPSTLEWLRDLHINLLMGPLGNTLSGLFGIVLLLALTAGLLLWWPSRGGFRRALKANWNPSTPLLRKLFDLHRLAGIYALLPLAIVTFSGALLIFQAPAQAVAKPFMDVSTTRVEPEKWPDLGAVGLDRARDVVWSLYPAATIRRVSMPTATRPVFMFQIQPAGKSRLRTTNVAIDAATGRPRYIFDPQRQATARSFIGLWSVFIHNGAILGSLGRWLVLLTGAIYAALLVTGLWIWVRKRGTGRRVPG